MNLEWKIRLVVQAENSKAYACFPADYYSDYNIVSLPPLLKSPLLLPRKRLTYGIFDADKKCYKLQDKTIIRDEVEVIKSGNHS